MTKLLQWESDEPIAAPRTEQNPAAQSALAKGPTPKGSHEVRQALEMVRDARLLSAAPFSRRPKIGRAGSKSWVPSVLDFHHAEEIPPLILEATEPDAVFDRHLQSFKPLHPGEIQNDVHHQRHESQQQEQMGAP